MNGTRFSPLSSRMGQDIRAWPMLALLLLVVLGAIGSVLWFMREAMRNERMAVRQRLTEAYKGQLAFLQQRVAEQWKNDLSRFDASEPAAALFMRAVKEGWADSAIFPSAPPEARAAEANQELLALEKDPANTALAEKLRTRVMDYELHPLPSAQRRFLMRELQRFAPGTPPFPTLAAEDLAARYGEATSGTVPSEALSPSPLPGIWHVLSPGKKAVALFETATLQRKFDTLTHDPSLTPGVRVSTLPPGEEWESALTLMPLGASLPGWRLALSLGDRSMLDTAADRKVVAYLWTGCLAASAMAVLAFFIARGFRRQVQLARLKNDLVATVSHELKTPLTAMRALVDTLVDSERFDEKQTREYLGLLARENARLSRLIDHFLTFSRLERNKFRFEFAPVHPQRIIDGAIAALGERSAAVETHAASHLPPVTGDADALITAVLNLLDNAWKYSGEEKRIVLKAEARNGSVCLAVEDNGIGLAPQERSHVFDRFYQADQRLSRSAGGCGLGLSIVQSIVKAHRGSVSVTSEPGRGSVFTIELPASAA